MFIVQQVYEQSTSARETGAAIHLAPNANGILRRLGIFAERFGANQMERVSLFLEIKHATRMTRVNEMQLSEYNHTGEQLRMIDLRESNKQWQHVSEPDLYPPGYFRSLT